MPHLAYSLRYLIAGAGVRRYHTSPVVGQETVGHHSHAVASLLTLIYPDSSRELLIAALYHDLGEQQTGDIPSPGKREMGIRDAVNKYEAECNAEAGFHTPTLFAKEKRRLKFADCVSGALFCLEELAAGNRRMWSTFMTYMTYINTLIENGHEPCEAPIIQHLMKEGDLYRP